MAREMFVINDDKTTVDEFQQGVDDLIDIRSLMRRHPSKLTHHR
jgi:hypothetical protein